MTRLYWQTTGEGDRDLVMLHGWGLNAGVWEHLIARLSPHFRLHLADLPGYGRSADFPAMSLDAMAETVLNQHPNAPCGSAGRWAGWSPAALRYRTRRAYPA